MSEEATLRDVTAPNPSEPAEPKEAAKPAEDKPAVVSDPAEADALEIGRLLLNSGYNKSQINQLLEAPNALQSIRNLIETDPKQFTKQLALSNPTAANKLRDAIAEEYVELFADKGGKKDADGKPDSQLMGEVAALRDEVKGFRTREDQRNMAAALASTEQRYRARIDDLFAQEGIKKLGLTGIEEESMKALLDKRLASDPDAVQRASKGNFVDVAPAFKPIIERWQSDKKSAAEREKNQRDNVQSSASFTFPGGPQSIEVPASISESWDATEEGFAKALQNAR